LKDTSLGNHTLLKTDYLNTEEKEFIFFRYQKFPLYCIGEVKLYILPSQTTISCPPMKEIWIWTHPSLVRQVAAELRTHMTDLFTELNTTSTSINRFSLKGPTSATVLKYLIGPGPSPLIDAKSSESFSFFHQATQCTQLSAIWPPGIALAINIPDPRFQSSLFQRSISPMNANKKTNKILWPSEANASILWDSSMTAMIADAFRSDFVVNREKKAYVKAAWQAHFVEKDASKVVDDRILENSFNSPFVPKSPNESVYCPALLIRQEQKVSKRLMRQRSKDSLLSGWDIIVPAVWGRTIWKALQKPFMIDRYLVSLSCLSYSMNITCYLVVLKKHSSKEHLP